MMFSTPHSTFLCLYNGNPNQLIYKVYKNIVGGGWKMMEAN